jgi:L-fuculose-phosphate aldolase
MQPDDLIVIDYEGNVLEGDKKPSSELFMHLCIYKERPDINGVVHAHPPKATGFAVAGIPLTQCVLPEVIVSLGGIPLAEYGTPGTDELFTPVLKYLNDYDAFLLENHGALTIGADVMNAYYKMETLEHFAHIALTALQLGRLNALGQEDVQKLLDLRQKFGVRTQAGCESCETEEGATCSTTPSKPVSPDLSDLTQRITESIARKAPNLSASVDQDALVEAIAGAILKRLKT